VPAGSHALAVNAPRLALKRVEFDVATGSPTVDLGDIALEVGLAIRGRVRTRAGAPVAGARLTGRPMRPLALTSLPAEARTEDDGTFGPAGLAEASYRLLVTAPGYGGTDKEAEAGAQGVDIVLSPAGAVSGQVVDEAGHSVVPYDVQADVTGERAMR